MPCCCQKYRRSSPHLFHFLWSQTSFGQHLTQSVSCIFIGVWFQDRHSLERFSVGSLQWEAALWESHRTHLTTLEICSRFMVLSLTQFCCCHLLMCHTVRVCYLLSGLLITNPALLTSLIDIKSFKMLWYFLVGRSICKILKNLLDWYLMLVFMPWLMLFKEFLNSLHSCFLVMFWVAMEICHISSGWSVT